MKEGRKRRRIKKIGGRDGRKEGSHRREKIKGEESKNIKEDPRLMTFFLSVGAVFIGNLSEEL